MKVRRETAETRIDVELVPGSGMASVTTAVPFLDHMMITLAKYSGLDVDIKAEGDLRHHIVEDVAISVAAAFAEILPEKCSRYGNSVVAMDDALVQASLDAGGRGYYEGPIPSGLYDHWMRSFAMNAGLTLHLCVLRGSDRHHIVEASFKALGFAIRQALVEQDAVFSTKGSVVVRHG
jgi:imidazoleglycerol-phosphate dehydratase